VKIPWSKVNDAKVVRTSKLSRGTGKLGHEADIAPNFHRVLPLIQCRLSANWNWSSGI